MSTRRKISKMILFGILLIFSASIGSESFYQDPEISQEQLDEILKKCAEYCEKLSHSVLDFVCTEKISEEIFHTFGGERTPVVDMPDGTMMGGITRAQREINNYDYDYQMIRKDNKITNRRILMRENGTRKNEVDAQLKTKRFKHNDIVYGPIALLDALWQPHYDYEIVGKRKFERENVIVIEATPKDAMASENPFGNLWVKEDDFSIVKIEWDQGSLPFIEMVETEAATFASKPEIKVEAEYTIEKNGIRFPSKYSIIETYYTGRKKKGVRSRLYVTYKDYKFFTVESEVKY